jgi:hypothetical protein
VAGSGVGADAEAEAEELAFPLAAEEDGLLGWLLKGALLRG